MISIIQIVLATGILAIGVYSYQRLRSSYLDAILIFFIMATGLLFVFFPGLANRVADFLGVGRGADMVFYICILFFFFLIIKLYAKTRKLEQIITGIIRKESIKNASSPVDIDPYKKDDELN